MLNNLKMKGFSLIEIMIVVGILGGMVLTISNIISMMQKGQVTSEIKMEELEIKRQVALILLDKIACEKTLVGSTVGSNIIEIKNNLGNALYSVNSNYGSNALKIESIYTQDQNQTFSDGTKLINLVIVLRKLKSVVKQNVKPINIQLKIKTNEAGLITSCFADNDSIAQGVCTVFGGEWSGSGCNLNNFVKIAGDTMTGELKVPNLSVLNILKVPFANIKNLTSEVVSIDSRITSNLFCTGLNCKSINDFALANQTCLPGQLQFGVKSDGQINCKFIQCSGNSYFAGLDGFGNVICRPYPTNTCPTNQYVSQVNSDGTVLCSIIPNNSNSICPDGQVVQSVVAGVPKCINRGSGVTCPEGQFINSILNDGSAVCGFNKLGNDYIGIFPQPPKFERRCPLGKVMVGVTSSEEPICEVPTLGKTVCTCPTLDSITAPSVCLGHAPTFICTKSISGQSCYSTPTGGLYYGKWSCIEL